PSVAPERVVETVEKIVEVPVLNGQVAELREVVGLLDGSVRQLGEVFAGVKDIGGSIIAAIDRVSAAPRPAPVIPAVHIGVGREPDRGRTAAPPAQREASVSRPAAEVSPRLPAEPGSTDFGAVKLDAGARRMLSALAWF